MLIEFDDTLDDGSRREADVAMVDDAGATGNQNSLKWEWRDSGPLETGDAQ